MNMAIPSLQLWSDCGLVADTTLSDQGLVADTTWLDWGLGADTIPGSTVGWEETYGNYDYLVWMKAGNRYYLVWIRTGSRYYLAWMRLGSRYYLAWMRAWSRYYPSSSCLMNMAKPIITTSTYFYFSSKMDIVNILCLRNAFQTS